MADASNKASSPKTRRHFMKTTAVAGGALIGSLAVPRGVYANGGDTLRVGLIGCGGRGSSAAGQALNADKNVKLVAMGDAFADRLELSKTTLQKKFADKVAVDDDHCFVGFDAYKQVIASDVDVVLLTTPPHFRPAHLKAAVDAGKHVFCEKPVAVDAPGIRSVLETVEKAREKNLSLVSGLCWRYDHGVRETIQRIQDGAIGDIIAIQENYLAGELWHRGNDPKWSDMEYQMRNWLYYTWLSGDHNVEQHIHSLDKASWLMGDQPPKEATGLGGRQVRTGEKWGHIFDHHAVIYEYESGVKVFAFTRQQDGCKNNTEDYILGSKGRCSVLRNTITSNSGETLWRFRGSKPSMYQVEHNELFASIRSGNPINNGVYMARSSMLAILGRMATYTGQTITWKQAMESQEDLTPAKYEWGSLATPQVAIPGVTRLV